MINQKKIFLIEITKLLFLTKKFNLEKKKKKKEKTKQTNKNPQLIKITVFKSGFLFV